MKAEKDTKTGKWLIQYRYTDWQGERKKSTKRGFSTKREAEEWVRIFLIAQQADFNMSFEEFIKLYYEDIAPRVRENTLRTKKYLIEQKILPYFGKKAVNSIKPTDIRKWQNEMIKQDFAPTYLRTINNQLSAIFNFAVTYYDLKSNPCQKAGAMGKSHADEMDFWTKDEFSRFIEFVMDKQRSYVGFKMLFWTGVRIGELLALSVEDIDFEEKTLTISKSYQRIGKRDVITPPKTLKGNRVLSVPDFLLNDLKDYVDSMYKPEPKDRLFPVTKHFFENEMKRGCQLSGVKKIRLHDTRHSHCALLFEMNIPILEIAERLGHEKVDTTLNIYAHIYPNKQRQLSHKLNQIYGEEY